MGETFQKRDRILRGRDFDFVMKTGRRVRTENLLLFVAEGQGQGPRVGLAVGRKVGCAPRRNRWKRLIRETFRLRLKRILPTLDVVVSVRPVATRRRQGEVTGVEPVHVRKLCLAEVADELLGGLRRLGLAVEVPVEGSSAPGSGSD